MPCFPQENSRHASNKFSNEIISSKLRLKHPIWLPPPNGLNELPILKKLTDAYKLWHTAFRHLPRLSRFTLGAKVDAIFCEVIEHILTAGYAARENKILWLQRASIKLDSLKYFLKLAWELKALNTGCFSEISHKLVEVGKDLGGWLKDLKKQTPT
ncbi:MAG: four helix bundle protein [bacterium]